MANFNEYNIPDKNDYSQNLTDKAIKETRKQLNNMPLVNGQLIRGIEVNGKTTDGISLSAGVDTVIYHALGRPWVGWIVTRIYGHSGNAIIKESLVQPSNPDGSKCLSIVASANCTIHLYVF